ncbi:MAG: hypothetical protein ACREHG_06210, partial [Candidatus Saccharimonadales bacterium]
RVSEAFGELITPAQFIGKALGVMHRNPALFDHLPGEGSRLPFGDQGRNISLLRDGLAYGSFLGEHSDTFINGIEAELAFAEIEAADDRHLAYDRIFGMLGVAGGYRAFNLRRGGRQLSNVNLERRAA